MANSWLPGWVGALWTVVFVIIVVVHLWHIIVMSGRHRLWHATHTLVALGMIVMFAPTDHMIVSSGIGEIVFAAAALVVIGLLICDLVHRGTIGTIWLLAVVDLAAMVYMFAMVTTRLVWLTIPLVVWFILQTLGWATGRLYTAAGRSGLGDPQSARALGGVGAARLSGSADDRPPRSAAVHAHASSAHRFAICATLALMALGMAYMFLAMQFGVSAMANMTGM